MEGSVFIHPLPEASYGAFVCIFLSCAHAVISGPSRTEDSAAERQRAPSPPPASSKLGRLLSDSVAALTFSLKLLKARKWLFEVLIAHVPRWAPTLQPTSAAGNE